MSVLKEAIVALSDNHNLMPGIDSNKKRRREEDDCPLSSGIEYSFVGVFCQEILREIAHGNPIEYHHIFYISNLKAEAKVGYDLSIGNYLQSDRVRTMHKVINERYCDQPWTYRFKYGRNESGEFTGDYGHFMKLLYEHQGDLEHPGAQIFPYLVINICHCIHDYRRMGTIYEPEQLTMPSFRSLLRTIIVDLIALRDQIDRLGIDPLSNRFFFKISRRPEKRLPDEISPHYITRITNKTNLYLECGGQNIHPQNLILSFDEFIQQIDWNGLMYIMPI